MPNIERLDHGWSFARPLVLLQFQWRPEVSWGTEGRNPCNAPVRMDEGEGVVPLAERAMFLVTLPKIAPLRGKRLMAS